MSFLKDFGRGRRALVLDGRSGDFGSVLGSFNVGGGLGTGGSSAEGILVVSQERVRASSQVGHGQHAVDHNLGVGLLLVNLLHHTQNSQHDHFFTALHATNVIHTQHDPPNTRIEVLGHFTVQKTPQHIGALRGKKKRLESCRIQWSNARVGVVGTHCITGNSESNSFNAAVFSLKVLVKRFGNGGECALLLSAHPPAVHFFHERFAQKGHIEEFRALVAFNEFLVGLVGQEPGAEFHAGDGFEGIVATAGIIVTLETPMIHIVGGELRVDPQVLRLDVSKVLGGVRDGFQKEKERKGNPHKRQNATGAGIGVTEIGTMSRSHIAHVGRHSTAGVAHVQGALGQMIQIQRSCLHTGIATLGSEQILNITVICWTHDAMTTSMRTTTTRTERKG